MHEVGFEPTKRFASDLKSDPFDQTRVPMLKFKKSITIRYFSLPDYLR